MNLLTMFSRKKDEQKESAEDALHRLALLQADGVDASQDDVDALERALSATGMTDAEFAAMVTGIKTRRELAATAQRLPEIIQAIATSDAETKRRTDDLIRLQQEFNDWVIADNQHKTQLQQQRTDAQTAHNRLRESAPKYLHDQARELRAEQSKLQESVANARRIVKEATELSAKAEREVAEAKSRRQERGFYAEWEDALKFQSSRLQAAQNTLAELEPRLREIPGELGAVESAMLTVE